MNAEPSVGYGIVVDASVAIKWHLRDEDLSAKATALLAEHASGRLRLTAPAFIRYEMANALEQARRRGRISDTDALLEFDTFLGYGIHDAEDRSELIAAAQRIAAQIAVSVYDAVYVALAQSLGVGLVSNDGPLLRSLAGYPLTVYRLADMDGSL